MARKYNKPMKQRSVIIKIENKVQPVFGIEYYALIGGKWLFISSGFLGKVFTIAETVRKGTPLLYSEKQLEEWAGRKINFKRESFIHEWTSNNICRDYSI